MAGGSSLFLNIGMNSVHTLSRPLAGCRLRPDSTALELIWHLLIKLTWRNLHLKLRLPHRSHLDFACFGTLLSCGGHLIFDLSGLLHFRCMLQDDDVFGYSLGFHSVNYSSRWRSHARLFVFAGLGRSLVFQYFNWWFHHLYWYYINRFLVIIRKIKL